MKQFGIKVLIEKTKDFGYILRRLNSESYEIWIESKNEISILSPDEFKEINEGNENE